MTQLSQQILVYSRACEHLLSTEITLNDDERSLVEYYVKEISREFISLGPTMHETAAQQ
jgi:hypothetical protein